MRKEVNEMTDRKEYFIRYRLEHKIEHYASDKNWRKNNPEKYAAICKKRYQKNPKKYIEKSIKYLKEHPEIKSAIAKRYYQKHKEEIGIKNKIYKMLNKDKFRIYYRNHNIKRKGWVKPVFLNSYFEGSEGHHLTKEIVIYIPAFLHKSVYHNLEKGTNMVRINCLVWCWWNGFI